MRKAFKLLFMIIWLCAVYYGFNWHRPTLAELEPLSGTITQIQEIPAQRRKNKWHIEISMTHNGIVRTLASYDNKLLQKLKVGDSIKAGAFYQKRMSELWTLNTSEMSISIADTQQARKDQQGYLHYLLYAVGLFLVFLILFKKDTEWIRFR